jgi:hypothetical protein
MSGEAPEWRVRWARGADAPIAEIAEALGVPTDAVMGVTAHAGNRATVLFTPPEDTRRLPAVFAQHFTRDDDGILRPAGEPFELPGYLEELERNIERELTRKLGPPQSKRRKRKR